MARCVRRSPRYGHGADPYERKHHRRTPHQHAVKGCDEAGREKAQRRRRAHSHGGGASSACRIRPLVAC
ncbi:hypothetical protein AOB60_43065 [Streptomyces noursei]|uniref:Uncharacterized protein n=1 Tax=Streptomyces noursei TaxID=1971 RepID=A0A2N8P424_STRNR|nr:hypothetical protein AOB60_43065 [Streptomyces noursei]